MTNRELKTEIVDLAASTKLHNRLERQAAREMPAELSTDWRKWKQRDEWRSTFIAAKLDELGDDAKRVWKKRSIFRNYHIAASLLRGTPYHRIERPAPGNEPDWGAINALIDEYSNQDKLTVVVSKDLSVGEQAAQGGHAVAEWLLHAALRDRAIWRGWQNKRLVCLEASGDVITHYRAIKHERAYADQELRSSKGEPVPFHEQGGKHHGKLTALAVLGEYDCLKGLPLLGEGDDTKDKASGYKEDEPNGGLFSRVFN